MQVTTGASPDRAHAPADGPRDLLDTFESWMIGGRWLLVSAATAESVLILASENPGPRVQLALLIFFLYNVTSLVLLHRLPIRRVPFPALLTLDLALVAVVAAKTGGSNSAFLGQYYLIIFAAAVVYGRRGGLIVSAAAALITTALAFGSPSGFWGDLRDLIPYFLVAGGFSGLLMDRLHTWFSAYQETQGLLRVREIEAEGARREAELARAMQHAALPAVAPRVLGLEIAARTEFAREVGGDFYLFVEGRERLGLVIGDVSGKGVPAALAATSIGHLLPWLRPLENAEEAIRSLNRDLVERMPADAFVTLCLVEIDAEGGRARLWSAGHPPALLCRASSGRVEVAALHNPLLGVFPDWHGEAEEWTIRPGDVLLLYTDGLTETRGEDRDLFGSERVGRVLQQHAGRSAGEILDAIMESLTQWGTPTDDITLVVCRYLGPQQKAKTNESARIDPGALPGDVELLP